MGRLGLTRRQLEVLCAIVESGSFAQAAEQLHVTASALSHNLSELETRIGEPLLKRRSRPVVPTEQGRRVIESARDILSRFERLERELLRQDEQSGRLHLAIECHSCYRWLMPTLNAFREQWPAVELDILSGQHFDAMPALCAGDLDVVVTSDPEPLPGIQYIPLFRYEALLAVPPSHPLVEKGFASEQDLAAETLIHYPVEENKLDVFRLFLTPAGLRPQALRQVELTMMMVQLVVSGRGVCALPNWALDEYLERGYVSAVSLGRAGVFSTLYVAVRETDLALAYYRDFVLLAKDLPFGELHGIARPIEA